ncbi:MAG TPA: NRDE family protein [Gemmatimonadales bacterium]|nr:NRDE family protein [Gemmatimonadales bacterium]
MCLILAALGAHPDYALVVAANRDEFYDRPTASAAFWPEQPQILGGRDLRAGGTWLAIDRAARVAAVTNYRQGEREGAAPRSRGLLVSDYLSSDADAGAYAARIEREGAEYNGFNLLVGGARELYWLSNREGRPRRLEPGIYGLSNHLLDTPWPKVTSGKSILQSLLGGNGADLESGLFALLGDNTQVPDDALPSTGIGLAWERLLSSAFIASAEYGTRSSTVVLVGRDGGVTFVERSFGPGGVAAGEVRYAFRAAAG